MKTLDSYKVKRGLFSVKVGYSDYSANCYTCLQKIGDGSGVGNLPSLPFLPDVELSSEALSRHSNDSGWSPSGTWLRDVFAVHHLSQHEKTVPGAHNFSIGGRISHLFRKPLGHFPYVAFAKVGTGTIYQDLIGIFVC